jgi:hypothetical protein
MSGELFDLVIDRNGASALAHDPRRTAVDRRKRARTRLHWPVLMFRHRHGADAVESTTRDLSSGGFYCLTEVPLTEGEDLVCSIKVPTHDPQGKHLECALECKVRVVRVVPGAAGDLFGIGCRIETYRFGRGHPPPDRGSLW